MSKGYRSQLQNSNRPVNGPDRVAWDMNANKAVGIMLTYIESHVVSQFEDKNTPQELFKAIEAHNSPDISQEIDRLEREFRNLSYNAEDPVLWVANIRGLLARLTAKGAPLTDRQVRVIVLRALEEEPEYKVRVEIIRYSQPNITQADLWTAIRRFPYLLKRSENVLNVHNSLNTGKNMWQSAKYIKGGKKPNLFSN